MPLWSVSPLILQSNADFFTLSYGISWGPIAWTIPSEIFPTRVRAKGVALSTASNWVYLVPIHWVEDQQFSYRVDYSPNARCFPLGDILVLSPAALDSQCRFLGSFCALSAIWVWTCVPETSQIALEDMVTPSLKKITLGSSFWRYWRTTRKLSSSRIIGTTCTSGAQLIPQIMQRAKK